LNTVRDDINENRFLNAATKKSEILVNITTIGRVLQNTSLLKSHYKKNGTE